MIKIVKKIAFKYVFTIIALMCLVQLNAQQKTSLLSPQINPDNTVTFRLKSFTAGSVKVKGSWMNEKEVAIDMVKNDSIWSYTTAVLPGDFYRYNFFIDGVEAIDPLNSYVERAGIRQESIFIVPSEQSNLYTVNAVPHGTLSAVWYFSPTLGMQRRMYVYTPPSYLENPNQKYPVLYLLHGAGGDEYSWIARGPVTAVMDNLIAMGKAKEMIVVVTNGYPFQAASPNAGPVIINDQKTVTETMANGRFEASLVNDVIPFIEKRFRVIANKNNRAIAGFSMGGLQTQKITNANPDLFNYIGVMSMGLMDDNRFGVYNKELHLQQLKTLIKSHPKLYWIGTGKEDFLYASVVKLRKLYDEIGLHYEYRESDGGHTWNNWSLYLSELAPKFFK